jgi:hypothetical protein
MKQTLMHGAVCTSSIVGIDDGHGPERAIDGLKQTYYRAAKPARKGDWWRVDFGEPVTGSFSVISGDGKDCPCIRNACFEFSADGKNWSRAGRFSGKSDECVFKVLVPVLHVRIKMEGTSPQDFAIRSVTLDAR